MFTFRDRSKVVDLLDYVLVASLFFCSITRICIRKRFWSRVVDILCKHPSNTYIVICSDLLRRWTLHNFPHGEFTQVFFSGIYTHQQTVNELVMKIDLACLGWFLPHPPKKNLFGSAMLCCYLILLCSKDAIQSYSFIRSF